MPLSKGLKKFQETTTPYAKAIEDFVAHAHLGVGERSSEEQSQMDFLGSTIREFLEPSPEQAMMLNPIGATAKLAALSRPGFSEEAWSGPAKIGKFLEDLPPIFDFMNPKGIKVVDPKSFRPQKQRIPFSKGLTTEVRPSGIFIPPDPLMGTASQTLVRDISPEGMKGEYTTIHQGTTVSHELAHQADAIRQAIASFIENTGEIPSKNPEKLYNQIIHYIPQTAMDYSEMQANRIAARVPNVTPIGFAKERGLLSGDPKPGSLSDKVMQDILKILKLGSLD